MRFLTPSLVVSGIWLCSWGAAFAQSPAADAPIDETHRGDVAILAPTLPRVRAVDSGLAALIAQATARSTTFRRLVEAIDRTDGLVYVERGRCGRGARACLVAVGTAGTSRIVRVRVGSKEDAADVMASIGHELQHALEVLGNPRVTSTAAMLAFYHREGLRRGDVFETTAAMRAGDAVRSETRRNAPVAATR